MRGWKRWTMGVLVLTALIWGLPPQVAPLFHMTAAAWADDVPDVDFTAQISVATANARSRLDRRTRLITSEADVTLTHQGTEEIPTPLWAVIDISTAGVSMPDADGTWAGPDGDWSPKLFYYDLSGMIAGETFAPGDTVTFHVKFVRSYRVRFTYNIWLFGPDAAAGNQPPVADAGQDVTLSLLPGQSEVSIMLDGSGSHDDDGSIASYRWSGSPDPDDVAQPGLSLAAGQYEFSLVVTDDQGTESPLDTVTVTVEAANPHAPEISVDPASVTVNEGETATVAVSASDPDGDPVTLSAAPRIANAAFAAGAGTSAAGTFTFTPDHGQQGIYTVAFTARDPYGYTTTRTAQVTVTNVNRPPELSVQTPPAVDEGGLLTVAVQANDPDGDLLTLTAAGVPPNAVFIPATGTLTFAPDFDQAGTYAVTFAAADGQETVSQEVALTVNDVSDPGGGSELTLEVDHPESPTLQTTARITGRVNSQGGAQVQKIETSLITGLAPASARQGQTLAVTLTGQASGDFVTHFADGVSQVGFGEGVTVNSMTVNSETEIVADITIADDAATGPRGATVTTGSETAVSMLAFAVTPGQSALSGTLVDPDTGQAIAGATVTIQGTGFTAITGADGSFSFGDVPPGAYTVIVNAPDHELRSLSFTAAAGASTDLGSIEAPATVFDPSAPPSVSLHSVMGRGISRLSWNQGREALRQLIIDALLLVGGVDGGVLDEYGNQLNPEVTGNGVVSLKDKGVAYIAEETMKGNTFSLGDMLFFISYGFQWEGREYPLTLSEWVEGLQEMVNQAWADPDNPDHHIAFLLFNQSNVLTPDPPAISPAMRLSPFRAFLLTASMAAYMKSVQEAALEPQFRSIRQALASLAGRTVWTVKNWLLPSAFADLPPSRFTRFWRNFFDTKSTYPVLTMTQGMAEFSAQATIMMMAPVAGGVAGLGLVQVIAGSAAMDLSPYVSAIAMSANVPESPTILSAKSDGGTVRIEFEKSVSDHDSSRYFYNLLHFDNATDTPRVVAAGFTPVRNGSHFAVFDNQAPQSGTGFYAMTVTRSATLGGMLATAGYTRQSMMPWWALPLSGVPPQAQVMMKRYGRTSDYSTPYIYTAGPQPDVGGIDAVAVGPVSGDVYASIPASQEVRRAANTDSLLESLEPFLSTGFVAPGQKGLAVDPNGNLYTDNAASDGSYGGRIFRFTPLGQKEFVGSVNYFSQMLMYANPVSVGPMALGPDGELYLFEKMSREIRKVPVNADYDANRRVGHRYFDMDFPLFSDVLDLQFVYEFSSFKMFILDPRGIVEVPLFFGDGATTTIFDFIAFD